MVRIPLVQLPLVQLLPWCSYFVQLLIPCQQFLTSGSSCGAATFGTAAAIVQLLRAAAEPLPVAPDQWELMRCSYSWCRCLVQPPCVQLLPLWPTLRRHIFASTGGQQLSKGNALTGRCSQRAMAGRGASSSHLAMLLKVNAHTGRCSQRAMAARGASSSHGVIVLRRGQARPIGHTWRALLSHHLGFVLVSPSSGSRQSNSLRSPCRMSGSLSVR